MLQIFYHHRSRGMQTVYRYVAVATQYFYSNFPCDYQTLIYNTFITSFSLPAVCTFAHVFPIRISSTRPQHTPRVTYSYSRVEDQEGI